MPQTFNGQSVFLNILTQLIEIKENSLGLLASHRDQLVAELAGSGTTRERVSRLRWVAATRRAQIMAVVQARQTYVAALQPGDTDLLTPAIVAGLRSVYNNENLDASLVVSFIQNLLAQWEAVIAACDAVLPTPPYHTFEMVHPGPQQQAAKQNITVPASADTQALVTALNTVLATLGE